MKTKKNEMTPVSKQNNVEQMTILSINTLRMAKNNIEKLAKTRAQNKLSNSRVTTVARELNELIKVMSIYNS